MRHRNHTFKLGRTGSHNRCMLANMLKSLIVNGRVETTLIKAKELRREADKIISLAKKDSLANRRRVIAKLMIKYNHLSSKEARLAKKDSDKVYNDDRKVIKILFDNLSSRFIARNGGYTRIVKTGFRVGDNAPMCFIEYLQEEVATAK